MSVTRSGGLRRTRADVAEVVGILAAAGLRRVLWAPPQATLELHEGCCTMRKAGGNLIACAGVAGMLLAAPGWAIETTTLPAVQVNAVRLDIPSFDLPASLSVVAVAPADAGQPGVNLSEALVGVPGILARDRQNYAQDEQISIRGYGARATFGVRSIRLYVDGIPATLPDGQGQVSHFNLDSAERVEVLRGPFSVLYGNAAGGVVQVWSA